MDSRFKENCMLLEAEFRQRSGPSYYRTEKRPDRGVLVVANCDIHQNDVIWVEEALYKEPIENYHPSVQQNPEFGYIMQQMNAFAQSHGHLTGAARYPPEACKLMDRLTELNTSAYASSESPNNNLPEIWKLEDSHRVARTGDVVYVDGLQSAAGQRLNGKQGRVLGPDDKDPNRLAVGGLLSDEENNNKDVKKKSIKQNNLKTLGGILRTNAFTSDTDSNKYLFKDLCRVNHACGDNANILKIIWNEKAFVLATRNIRAGEELLIDYIPGEAESDRLALLKLKYNFDCDCRLHP